LEFFGECYHQRLLALGLLLSQFCLIKKTNENKGNFIRTFLVIFQSIDNLLEEKQILKLQVKRNEKK
jgi:hypothetical protein